MQESFVVHIWDKFENIQKVVGMFEKYVPEKEHTHKVVKGSTPMVCR